MRTTAAPVIGMAGEFDRRPCAFNGVAAPTNAALATSLLGLAPALSEGVEFSAATLRDIREMTINIE